MHDKTILVIDDSATIRKLVDTHLTTAGYIVVAAPTAEEGISQAQELCPDLILLDHQLPGTTGFEVCQELVKIKELAQTPVVISSTLRKKAYVEYADLDNVVDMLPKPYTEELLVTTVANAIETAEMVLAAQSKGAAVAEIIGDKVDVDIQGSFSGFELREIIDMLNNGLKRGVLEIHGQRMRLSVFLDQGRIQGMSATGVSTADIESIASRLPESLKNLREVLNLTIAGRGSSEFESFLQLLDRRVLDPRLTSALLRFQASQLMGLMSDRELETFEFRSLKELPKLHQNLALETSLLGLMVQYAMHCDESDLPTDYQVKAFVRRPVRGQNLDRSGLSARHMKVLSAISDPISIQDLSARSGIDPQELHRVLYGLELAGFARKQTTKHESKFVVYEPNTTLADKLRAEFKQPKDGFVGKVVRDPLTLQLLVKRAKPQAVFFAIDQVEGCEAIKELVQADPDVYQSTTSILLLPPELAENQSIDWHEQLGFQPSGFQSSPYDIDSLVDALRQPPSEAQGTQQDGDENVGSPAVPTADLATQSSQEAVH